MGRGSRPYRRPPMKHERVMSGRTWVGNVLARRALQSADVGLSAPTRKGVLLERWRAQSILTTPTIRDLRLRVADVRAHERLSGAGRDDIA
jgi:hypothetical protein